MIASYSGAIDFLAADDATTRQQIVPPATVTTIATNLNPSAVGDNVTFTSTVSSGNPALVPMGSVTFKDGTASFATVLVTPKGVQNVAQATISTLTAGTHSITAIYSGDASTSAGVSKVLVQQVDNPVTPVQPGYTLTVTPASVSIVAGASAVLNVTVAPLGGFAGAVAISCSNLPNESACTFDDATIRAGGGTATLTVITMSPHDCNFDVPYGGFGSPHPSAPPFGTKLPYEVPALAAVFAAFFPRRRRVLQTIICIAGGCILMAGVGCGGHCTDFGTNPGHYTFKVNGTAPPAASTAPGSTPGGPNVTASVAISVTI